VPINLYGHKTWFLVSEEEYREVWEWSAEGETSGRKWEEVTRGWKKPFNDEIHNFYFSPVISMIC